MHINDKPQEQPEEANDNAPNYQISIDEQKEEIDDNIPNYEMILELEFDDEEDKMWVGGYDENLGRLKFADGQLHVLKEGCNIDYSPKPGMIVHYKVKQPQYGSVGLSQYRINATISFECIYYNEINKQDYNTNNQNFVGLPFKNSGQFVDAIFYITPDGNAVYAIAIDEKAQRICYIAYQIPDFMKNDTLYMEINRFAEEGSVIVESVFVAEGSLTKYLKDNFDSYTTNQKRVDEFLGKEIITLPEMEFKPADEWD